ncbi:hypothetical protein MSZK_24840 [Mycobacterium sp. shizuoka-1]|nr:hypothetical protein MSZK_24840 [Mycobacterium sp. shizuoka-1]
MTPVASRRDVVKYALTAFAGAAVLGAPRASADGLRLVDFAVRQVAPEQIKAAGYGGALVYVSELRPGATFDFKPVTRSYTDGLIAAGLHVVSCYQFGKPGWPTPSDFTRGYNGGVADAQTAPAAARRRGWSGFRADLLQRRRGHLRGHVEIGCAAVVSRHQFGPRCRAHRYLRRSPPMRMGDR